MSDRLIQLPDGSWVRPSAVTAITTLAAATVCGQHFLDRVVVMLGKQYYSAPMPGPGAWDANPEVVALTFTVRKGNIDE